MKRSTILLLPLICFPFLTRNLAGAELDASQLPPAATVEIGFERDIKPILENACLRCHGPERPRSGFRLDARDAALKGGNQNGDDIVPGDSSRSRLIYYVAGLVPDMEMPPSGKGERMTPEQIGLLRAWIDQGAIWDAAPAQSKLTVEMAPALRWIDVEGDRRKFREIEGIKEGWGGGVEHFSASQVTGDREISVSGHWLATDEDVAVTLQWRKRDLGFVRGGFEHWRTWYDDTGGHHPDSIPPSFDLNRDLHLDQGRAWIDLGLTLPRWPELVLGYEYRFREGEKSLLQWGFVGGRNLYPAAKSIDEQTHILKLDLAHEIGGWEFANHARVEFHRQRNRSDEAHVFGPGAAPTTFVRTREDHDHVRGMNVLSVDRKLADWWLVSGGYHYSRVAAEGSLNQVTTDAANAFALGNFWRADEITLRRESHLFSASTLFTPLETLSISFGIQNEWTRQEGFGDASLDFGNPDIPGLFFEFPVTVRSDLDQYKTAQHLNVRFTGIPFTVLFIDGRFQQDRIGQFEREDGAVPQAFLRQTDYTNRRRDLRAGFSLSPWRRVHFNAQYRRFTSDSAYDDLLDSTPGYPAFITAREVETDQVQAKLTLRPARWVQAALTFQLGATDYRTETDSVAAGLSPGGWIFAGNSDAQTYGASVTLTPWPRFYCSGGATFTRSRLRAEDNGNASVVPYRGEVGTAYSSATFVLNERTDLSAAYAFSTADFGQGNAANGIPSGIEFTRHAVTAGLRRQLGQRVTMNLRYVFYQYGEPGTGRVNDYTAHGVFSTVNVSWP